MLGLFVALRCEAVQQQDEKGDSVTSPPQQVQIPGTQLLRINSALAGQEFELYVHLPRYYEGTSKTFPVLYLLDAQWDFPLVTALWGEQYYDGFVPGIIVVGIAWGGQNPNYDALRARDLTPTSLGQLPQAGNAPKFLDFIKQELIPFIESRYRAAKDDRTLMGSSLGGLFTLYALFHETELFNRYVLTSPTLGWDSEILYTYEKTYAEGRRQLPVKLFMAVGDLEGVADFRKFVDQMKARNYRGLQLETRVLENTGHSGTKAEGYGRGLQFVFARPSLKLAPAILEQYVGTYQLAPGVEIRVAKARDHLIAYGPDNAELVFYAETEKDFYHKGQYLFVHFQKDDAGKTTGFHLEQFAGEGFAKKIK